MDMLQALNDAAYAALRAHRRAPQPKRNRLMRICAEIDRIIDDHPAPEDLVMAAYERALIDMGLNPHSIAAAALKEKEGAQ